MTHVRYRCAFPSLTAPGPSERPGRLVGAAHPVSLQAAGSRDAGNTLLTVRVSTDSEQEGVRVHVIDTQRRGSPDHFYGGRVGPEKTGQRDTSQSSRNGGPHL